MDASNGSGLQYGSSGVALLTASPIRKRRHWSKTSADILKQRKHHEITTEDTKLREEKQREKNKELSEEKERDRQMLRDYQPWGKPSAGVPRLKESGSVDTKNRKLNWNQDESVDNGEFPFGRAGGGAPMKSLSGRVLAVLPKDPAIRFQPHLRREVDSLRYKESSREGPSEGRGRPAAPLPPQQGEEEQDRKRQALKHSRRLEEQIIEQRERRVRETSERRREAQSSYDPFGRGGPRRDSSGRVVPHTPRPLRKAQDGHDGSPFVIGTALPATAKPTEQPGSREPGLTKYDPWGRPGCGAPKKDSSGNSVANRTGALRRELEINSPSALLRKSQEKKAYLQILKETITSQKGSQPDSPTLAAGGVEVASWVRSGVVGAPPVDPTTGEFKGANRQLTDVVSNKLSLRRPDGKESGRYYMDLQQQAQERHLYRERERQQDLELGKKHLDALSKMWSSPHKSPQTKHPLHVDHKLKEGQQKYHRDLKAQTALQSQARSERNRQEMEEERRHVEAYNQQWGRPGCGAPNLGTPGQSKYKTSLQPTGNAIRRRS